MRGTLRNESKGDELLQRLSEEDRKRVEFVVVQDTAKSGLAEAVKGEFGDGAERRGGGIVRGEFILPFPPLLPFVQA